MKKLLISIGIFATLFTSAQAQCTNGDCAGGNGRFLYENGDRYLGEFKNHTPNGRGAYIFANGDVYKGQFKDGERHGYGTMEWKTGDKYIGDYVHNQRQGDGTYYFANGTMKKGVFKDGLLVQEFVPPAPPVVVVENTSDTSQNGTIANVDTSQNRGKDPFANTNSNTTTSSSSKKYAATAGIIDGEKRVALVIGNAGYTTSALKNSANDAQAMSDKLQQLGFEVWLCKDATKREMKQTIRDFGEYLKSEKAIGLFFFAGHGLQANGRNYLLPVDAEIRKSQDIEFEAFDLARILVELEFAENPMNIVILDACRDNPYKKEFGEHYKTHTGFTQIQNAPVNSVVAFSTAPGATASDGSGANGLYTQELLKSIDNIGSKKLEDIFKQVRTNVRKASAGKQIPWENSAIETDFYFKK
jgi:hypothetical protein